MGARVRKRQHSDSLAGEANALYDAPLRRRVSGAKLTLVVTRPYKAGGVM